MRHHLRFLTLCTIAVLTAGCSDTNEPSSPSSPQSMLTRGPIGEAEKCADIGDRVWLDLNCDGIQDKDEKGGYTEPGVAGVTVNLETCAGELLETTVTDATGFYLFDDVEDTVEYRVCFILPEGYTFAPKDAGGSEGGDSDANPDGCTDCFTVGDCKPVRYIDAGLCREKKEGDEGCTPGFWKNHYTHWALTGYSPDDIFDDVFGCEIFGDDTTLGEAVHVEWTHNVLAFHGVAALLNAAHPDVEYAYSESEVKELVCDGDKDALADANESLCPLSGGNTTGGGPEIESN